LRLLGVFQVGPNFKELALLFLNVSLELLNLLLLLLLCLFLSSALEPREAFLGLVVLTLLDLGLNRVSIPQSVIRLRRKRRFKGFDGER
jgi:hypothetical protein